MRLAGWLGAWRKSWVCGVCSALLDAARVLGNKSGLGAQLQIQLVGPTCPALVGSAPRLRSAPSSSSPAAWGRPSPNRYKASSSASHRQARGFERLRLLLLGPPQASWVNSRSVSTELCTRTACGSGGRVCMWTRTTARGCPQMSRYSRFGALTWAGQHERHHPWPGPGCQRRPQAVRGPGGAPGVQQGERSRGRLPSSGGAQRGTQVKPV